MTLLKWLASRWTWGAVAIGVAVLGVSHLSGNATAPRPSLVGAITIPEGSTPAPDFRLRDQIGAPITLQGLRGQVVVVAFLDSHCTESCPVEGAQLAMAQRRLGDRARFVLVVISVNPERDTASSVNEFASAREWTSEWHWLLGSREELSPVWKAYGVNVAASGDDTVHSLGMYLIDRKGFERAILTGDPATLTQDVDILASS